ncbi:hypothetical protein BDW67DRAFT_181572 [Aspergillus spinulosporus]
MSQLKELLMAVLECKAQSTPDGVQNGPAGPENTVETPHDDERAPASKMEYKTVNEVWDPKAYKYTIVNSPPRQDVSKLDKYVFVVRKRVWEFAVETIAKIQFSDRPFNMLAILEEKKKVIKSLTKSRVHAATNEKFDNIIKGKEQGIIILLQYISQLF